MEDLKKKILLDVCVTPATVIPFASGLSLLMLSVIMGSGWGFFGFCLCIFSAGMVVNNFIFWYDAIAKKAIEQLQEQKKQEKDRLLDDLDVKLASDRDPRDQEALRNLRGLYDSFLDDVKAGKVAVAAGALMQRQIDEIFEQCVVQLDKQHEIWLTSKKMSGSLKQGLMKQKNDILDEVEISVKSLTEVINEVRALGLKVQRGELSTLQQRLKNQLEAAKAVEQFTSEGSSNLSRFAEYENK